MKLEFIATLANERVKLRFLAMERSLRKQGCLIPIRVIPFNNSLFDLPNGSEWWDDPGFFSWLEEHGGNSYMRRYLCLSEKNYHFIDTDVIFLRNPSIVLEQHNGFITTCSHWHNPGHTLTSSSLIHFTRQSTTWQKQTFNSGQFACDKVLWSLQDLKEVMLSDGMRETCLHFKYHDQPGLNLLVLKSGINVTNLTLCPPYLESSWAGDYSEYPHHYWDDLNRMPYLLHWAGLPTYDVRPIDTLFLEYLSVSEKTEWQELCASAKSRDNLRNHPLRLAIRRMRKALYELIRTR